MDIDDAIHLRPAPASAVFLVYSRLCLTLRLEAVFREPSLENQIEVKTRPLGDRRRAKEIK